MSDAGEESSRTARVAAEGAAAAASLLLAALAWRADRAWWEIHVSPGACMTHPWEPGALTVARWMTVAVAVALAAVARPRLGRWVGRDARGALGATVRVALAVVLAVGAAELVVRSTRKASPLPPDVPAVQPDAHLGRVLVPSRTTVAVRGGRPISFAVNALGLRARSEDDMPDLSRPHVLLAGESVAQGYAVPYEESPAYLVEQETGVSTLAVSVSAYANDQVYERTRQILAVVAHPLAVVTLVVPLQIARNVDPRRERLALLDDGSLVTVPPSTGGLRLFELLDRVSPHGREALDVARAIVTATAKDARDRGAFPLFVATNFREPCLHDESGESSLAHRLFEGLGVTHVSVDLDRAWEVEGDGHPDVRGSRALASAVAAALRDAGVL
jgi:hypothetical protein